MNKNLDSHSQAHIQSDVQSEMAHELTPIQWVGMGAIESSVQLDKVLLTTKLDIFVNLLSGYRGIHMSRLYNLFINHFNQKELTLNLIEEFLKLCVQSQNNLSTQAKINLKFNLPVNTKSLKSQTPGFRQYPISLTSLYNENKKTFEHKIKFAVLYSSTCPQSAALSLEVLKDQACKNQSTAITNLERLPATPHAQRSQMHCTLILNSQNSKLKKSESLSQLLQTYITQVEATLGTAVQTSVKKIDEMTFAELNSENLMFCEDAVRKINSLFQKQKAKGELLKYTIQTQHEESLHPHNAVAMIEG